LGQCDNREAELKQSRHGDVELEAACVHDLPTRRRRVTMDWKLLALFPPVRPNLIRQDRARKFGRPGLTEQCGAVHLVSSAGAPAVRVYAKMGLSLLRMAVCRR